MATTIWRTCREHDGMRPPKLRPSRSIGRRVMAFRIFSNMAAVRHFEFKKKLIFNHEAVIEVINCCCVPNLIKIDSCVRPPDVYNCILHNVQRAVARQRTLPWQPQHGGHVVNMMGCDHPSCVPVGPLVGELWHFEYFLTWRPSAILNFKSFNIWSCDRHCGPNLLLYTKFQQTPILPNVQCAVARQQPPLLGNGCCHANRIMGDISGTWHDATTQVSSKSVHW